MPGLFSPPIPPVGVQMAPPPSNLQESFSQGVPQQVPPQQAEMTPEQAQVDAMDALAAQQQKPKYSVGDPHLDRYIQLFLGS